MINKILFSSKLYENDFVALKNIIPLKEVGLREIIFLHVIEPELVIVPKTGEFLKDEIERLKKLANVQFEEWSEYLKKFDIKTKSYILIGKPVEKILEISEKEKVSLITIGHQKHRSFLNLFITGLGSTALTLLKVVYIPIIVFPHDFTEEKNIYSDILIAVDFSRNSEEVVNYVVNLNPLVKKVTLVYVVENEEVIDNIEKIKNKLDSYKRYLVEKGIEAYHFIYYGKVAEKILEAAKEHNASLIAMGITGKHEEEKRRFNFFFIGSTTQKVVDLSNLPVLLIPPKREKLVENSSK